MEVGPPGARLETGGIWMRVMEQTELVAGGVKDLGNMGAPGANEAEGMRIIEGTDGGGVLELSIPYGSAPGVESICRAVAAGGGVTALCRLFANDTALAFCEATGVPGALRAILLVLTLLVLLLLPLLLIALTLLLEDIIVLRVGIVDEEVER